MRVKKVNRYYCDFCKKAGCSKGHMTKHEKSCTANPNRECGMCYILGEDQRPISDLLELLPSPKDFERPSLIGETTIGTCYDGLLEALLPSIERLRQETSGCPACILSALRQKGVCFILTSSEFDYKKERDEFWRKHNEEELRKEAYSYQY